MVVNGVTEFLFAAKVAFRRLHRGVTQEKLDLFQFPSCKVTRGTATADWWINFPSVASPALHFPDNTESRWRL